MQDELPVLGVRNPLTLNFDDCWDTLERTVAELEELEAKLAERFKCPPSRSVLLALDDAGELDDSPMVSDWRATYARYVDWQDGE